MRQSTYNPSTIILFDVLICKNPRNSSLTDRLGFNRRKIQIKYTRHSTNCDLLRIVFSTENDQITQIALSRRYCIFLSCVYRYHGLFPSLFVLTALKFQNVNVRIFTLFVCSLISPLVFKKEVLKIYIELFCCIL